MLILWLGDTMRNKKTYIVILVFLVVYLIVFYLFWGKNYLKKSAYTTTIMVGDNTIWSLKDKKWINITKKTSIDELNWQKFNVFVDNESLGNNYLWHDDKWYVFDDNKKAIPFSGKFLAYKSNATINVMTFQEEKIDDLTYVNEVLRDNNLSVNSKVTTSTKVSADIDSDSMNEDFYLISNAFSDEEVFDVLFSIVFMVKDQKIYYLYKDIYENDMNYNECKPYINYILDIDDDKKYEVILSCGKYSIQKQLDMLYEYTEEGFKIIISNQ